jgi:hypothetical protein
MTEQKSTMGSGDPCWLLSAKHSTAALLAASAKAAEAKAVATT